MVSGWCILSHTPYYYSSIIHQQLAGSRSTRCLTPHSREQLLQYQHQSPIVVVPQHPPLPPTLSHDPWLLNTITTTIASRTQQLWLVVVIPVPVWMMSHPFITGSSLMCLSHSQTLGPYWSLWCVSVSLYLYLYFCREIRDILKYILWLWVLRHP